MTDKTQKRIAEMYEMLKGLDPHNNLLAYARVEEGQVSYINSRSNELIRLCGNGDSETRAEQVDKGFLRKLESELQVQKGMRTDERLRKRRGISVIEPLEDLKKDLEEMSETGEEAVAYNRRIESSFLIRMNNRKGYVFRINKQGGLEVTCPLSVDISGKDHEKVIQTARKYFKEVRTSQRGGDIGALSYFYQL